MSGAGVAAANRRAAEGLQVAELPVLRLSRTSPCTPGSGRFPLECRPGFQVGCATFENFEKTVRSSVCIFCFPPLLRSPVSYGGLRTQNLDTLTTFFFTG